jgi:glutamyl-tRNA reductase
MIDGLFLLNLSKDASIEDLNTSGMFVLKTCQRTLLVGHGPTVPHSNEELIEQAQGKAAYHYLLETIVGLKSQVLAENEITGQFKEAYRHYLGASMRNVALMTILEKLFKDAKEIRSQYLREVGQQSYAGITRKILSSTLKDSGLVTILGSGQLAGDLVKLLHKRFALQICARNPDRVQELKGRHPQLLVHPWEDYNGLWRTPVIINTVGADETLFSDDFFKTWQTSHRHGRLFIDLSSPTVIQTSLTRDHGVIRLEDIFAHGVILNEEKRKKVESAREAITNLVERRHLNLRLT